MAKRLKFLLYFVLVLSLAANTACFASSSIALKVRDISDRKYEQAVINLLDNAKESIAISMYCINLGTNTRTPIKLLLNDLLEAKQRGVSVSLYLNTKRHCGVCYSAFFNLKGVLYVCR